MVVGGSGHNKHRRKLSQVKWIDSNSRFIAHVSAQQDSLPLVRLDIVATTAVQVDGMMTDAFSDTEDNLFIPIQEVLCLRPYQPQNAMLVVNPDLYEVSVCVDNFWSTHESGGNSGRRVRRGIAYVIGDTEALRRLCGERDKRFTSKGVTGQWKRTADASGVRSLTHTLSGGVKIRRQRTLRSSNVGIDCKWVCVDYSTTHVFHCTASNPTCTRRCGKNAAVVNASCLNRDELFLVRQHDNVHDENAIAVQFVRGGVHEVVGFVPREVAACLAPAIDAKLVEIPTKGVYSEDKPVATGTTKYPHYRVWFRVDSLVGAHVGSESDHSTIQLKLDAIPWWVATDEATPPSN